MDERKKIKLVLSKSAKDPVFFVEHFLNNTQMKPYKLEDQQKLFLRDTEPYKILFCSRRSGKTLTMIADILYKAFFRPNQQIVLLAPTLDQARTFSNVLNDMMLRSPMLQSSFILNNRMEKQLSNGSRIRFRSSGAASGKKEDSSMVGSSINTLYIDECQSMDAESLGVIMPVVTGQIGQAEIIMAGTPRARSGFFFDNIMNAKKIAECYVNNGIPKKCPNNGQYSLHRFQITDLDDNDNVMYSRAEYRLSIEELETIKSTIGVEKFRREYCLEFLDSISMPFYTDLINTANVLDEPKTFGSNAAACAGIDFGKRRNNSVLSVGIQARDGTWQIPYFKDWPLGTKYSVIIHFLNNILPKKFPNLRWLSIDATGVGQALAEEVNHESFYEVSDVIFSQPQKVNLVENTVYNMENKFVTMWAPKKLKKEMGEYTRETTENDRVIFTKGESDDYIDSFMLTNLSITNYMQSGIRRTSPFVLYSLGGNSLKSKPNNDKRGKYIKKRK